MQEAKRGPEDHFRGRSPWISPEERSRLSGIFRSLACRDGRREPLTVPNPGYFHRVARDSPCGYQQCLPLGEDRFAVHCQNNIATLEVGRRSWTVLIDLNQQNPAVVLQAHCGTLGVCQVIR